MKKQPDPTVVKVQISLESSDNKTHALVYDRSHIHMFQVEADAPLLKRMNGRPKAFFYAKLVGDKFEIGEEAPWQNW